MTDPQPMPAREPSRDELLAVYRLALEAHRSEVSLNNDRQKFYLTLNIAVVAAAGSISKLGQGPYFRWPTVSLLTMAAVVSYLGAIAVDVGHRYATRTRTVFQATEARLGMPADLAMQTTEGMRGDKRGSFWRRRLKMTTVTKTALILFAYAEGVMAAIVAFTS